MAENETQESTPSKKLLFDELLEQSGVPIVVAVGVLSDMKLTKKKDENVNLCTLAEFKKAKEKFMKRKVKI